MSRSKLVLSGITFALAIGAGLGFAYQESAKDSKKTEAKSEAKSEAKQEESIQEQFVPIDNMHHFMEYISQPAYKGLKAGLATEPEGRRAWRPLKAYALVLAETSALVSLRVPEGADEDQTRQWQQLSLDVYNSGKSLYESMGDYEKAKVHYSLMIDSCNQCHQVFEDGKHQLEK